MAHLEHGGVGKDLETYLEGADLTDGQRRRLRLLKDVEGWICERVEELCSTSSVEVTDVGVLVVAAEAQHLLFDAEIGPPAASVIVGHRHKVREFLLSALPPEPNGPDPYIDLVVPAPAQCIRILIVDGESLTVLSYGTFVTIRMHPSEIPEA